MLLYCNLTFLGDECETASEVDQILASPPKREPMGE